MDLLCFCSVLCLLCLCARLFICALWSPAGKGLTSIAQLVERPLSEREVVGSNPAAAPYQRCKKWY